MTSGFNRLARAYRWMEYLSFGPMLARCRFTFLHEASQARSALVLGDGDGRFSARLLANAPALTVTAVDSSPAMLQQLQRRCRFSGTEARLTTHCLDATLALPDGSYDLVVSHFFLDCLSTEQVCDLLRRVARSMRPGASWIVSEFRIPPGFLELPARVLVCSLYLAFRVLTGLRTQKLPEHVPAFLSHGFFLAQRRIRLRGLLVAERWTTLSAPALASKEHASHRRASNHAEVQRMSTIPTPDPSPTDLPPMPYPVESPSEPTTFPEPIPTPEPLSPTMPVFRAS